MCSKPEIVSAAEAIAMQSVSVASVRVYEVAYVWTFA